MDEMSIAYIPAAALLPNLLSRPAGPAANEASLLAIGEVDYRADAGRPLDFAKARSTPRSAQAAIDLAQMNALPGSGPEVEDIERIFKEQFAGGSVKLLRREEATEQAVREELPRQRFAHFATHGFFGRAVRPGTAGAVLSFGPSEQRDIAGFHPALLSGLALTGCSLPEALDRDDGVLTGLEIEAIHVAKLELAVLSACETGLGKVRASDGVQGLARSFHVGGTRSVVASLWSVPDAVTRLLMVRFYENLWKRKMGKLEALVEAQAWTREHGLEQDGVRRALTDELVSRNLSPVRAADEVGKMKRLPPYYWGAWVLSGDWR
jgi:CHAT domain-containing protein